MKKEKMLIFSVLYILRTHEKALLKHVGADFYEHNMLDMNFLM